MALNGDFLVFPSFSEMLMVPGVGKNLFDSPVRFFLILRSPTRFVDLSPKFLLWFLLLLPVGPG